MKTIVILVDNKRRDLPGAALIAHHLKKVGIRCELEPLGAWRSVLWAYKPDMILFNHLNAPHLEKYSQELRQRGILTAVLPNEGILYQKEILEFNASRFHNSSHIDHFFCWNHVHADAVKKTFTDKSTQVYVIGVPRFDFYFPPLAKTPRLNSRKKILICTNFIFSSFTEMDTAVAEHFFGRWSDAVPAYKNWKSLVSIDHAAFIKFFNFLNIVAEKTEHEIILRPHPNENHEPYKKWHHNLSDEVKQRVKYESEANIPDLILDCDLEVARDTCTTSLESWVAGKPTLDIHLLNNPIFHQEFTERLTSTCESVEDFPTMINDLLENGEPERFLEPRKEHLKKWCNTPDGHVCENFAELLKKIVSEQPNPDFSKIHFSDIRRGLRLKFLKWLGLPCTYKPLLSIQYKLNPEKYARKYQGYEKTIRPADVRGWMEKFNDLGV